MVTVWSKNGTANFLFSILKVPIPTSKNYYWENIPKSQVPTAFLLQADRSLHCVVVRTGGQEKWDKLPTDVITVEMVPSHSESSTGSQACYATTVVLEAEPAQCIAIAVPTPVTECLLLAYRLVFCFLDVSKYLCTCTHNVQALPLLYLDGSLIRSSQSCLNVGASCLIPTRTIDIVQQVCKK